MSEHLVIGSDHAGFAAKEQIKRYLTEQGFIIDDKGCLSEESVHYPLYGQAVARAVAGGEYARGILICGTGIGMSVTANRFRGVRAALCHNAFTARCSREHNNANILVLGARLLDWPAMREIIDIWLTTPFTGGRHAERIALIEQGADERERAAELKAAAREC